MISSKYRFHSRGGVKHTYKDGKTIQGQYVVKVGTFDNEKGLLKSEKIPYKLEE